MNAPARGIEEGRLLSTFEVVNGRKVYRQIDDELLNAIEADVQHGSPALGFMLGMMAARIREAEADRERLRETLKRIDLITALSVQPGVEGARLRKICELTSEVLP